MIGAQGTPASRNIARHSAAVRDAHAASTSSRSADWFEAQEPRIGDALRLMRELGRMGEGNALHQRRPGPMRRDTLVQACQLYAERFGDHAGRVPATFDILFMSGWKPHPSQQQPAPRGSASVRLADALRVPGAGS